MNNQILIFGGTGHLAGAELSMRVVEELNRRGALLDHEYPDIVTFNAAFGNTGLEGDGLEGYADYVNRMQTVYQPAVHVTACCTSYADRQSDPVFVRAIDCAIANILNNEKQHLVILQSAESQRRGLYASVIAAAASAGKTIHLVDADQCTNAIARQMEYDEYGHSSARTVNNNVGAMLMSGITSDIALNCIMFMGCTELCLANKPTRDQINMLHELAVATVDILKGE